MHNVKTAVAFHFIRHFKAFSSSDYLKRGDKLLTRRGQIRRLKIKQYHYVLFIYLEKCIEVDKA